MRHAKAETASGQGDHARPLSARGRTEAAGAARRLAALAEPGFALLSDSARTRQTFDCAAPALPPALPCRSTRALYGATAEAILAEVRTTSHAVGSLLVIGHNPGIGDLARRLAGTARETDRASLARGFPTSCFAIIDLAADSWDAVDGAGRLVFLLPADERSGP